jgi:Tol biopolymer transport system component
LPADRFATVDKFADALTRPDSTSMTADVAGVDGRPVPQAFRRRGVLVAAVAVVVASAAAWWLGRRSGARDAPWSDFVQLTDASGVETSPSLSPDGGSFAYASNARGTWDIFVQRVGGRNPVLVAGDSTADEVGPAYSPDGKQIAYSRRGDGIFVVGATGESPRRLTTFGFNPAWSPDGRRLVFGSEEVITAYNVQNTGSLWTVETSGGEPRPLDPQGPSDAYQPAWSPSGARIAFWVSSGGQRDLETIPAVGGPRVRVTDDAATDWAPVWSPDGKYLYFASDRGGTMGIWRIPVDEASGRATGLPEPIASGVDVQMDLPHLSKDGASLVFRSKMEWINPAAIGFDPVTGRAGAVRLLQHRTGILAPMDVSPDGKWLALANIPDRRQDLFIMRPDGAGLTRVTDDEARDWNPRFTPDGQGLTFFSNRSGSYQTWSIRLDGSGPTRLTEIKAGVTFSMLSPDGKRLLVGGLSSGGMIGAAPWPMTDQSAKPLTGLEVPGGTVAPTYWSRDGRWLSGYIVTPSGDPKGHALYEVATGRVRVLNDDSRSYDLAWLPGNRRVVYFTTRRKLVMQDIESLARREIQVTLPYPPDLMGSIAAMPDGRTIYYGAEQTEANIWLVKR